MSGQAGDAGFQYLDNAGQHQVGSLQTPAIASGAMTLTLNPRWEVFRNATSTSGGNNPVSVPLGAAITIPQGATLGAAAGQTATILVGLAYNGGVPVVIVGNSKDLDVDTSHLISPTTISAAATLTGVWYSASAVAANSPFKIIDAIDSTQAVAGTYATAPTVLAADVVRLALLGAHGMVNLAGLSSDVTLKIGQTGFIDFTAATSVPLHIATGDNQLYELTIMAAGNTGSNGATAGLMLNPNNTTYTNFFTTNTTNNANGAQGLGFYYLSAFMLSIYDPRSVKSTISTKTASKWVMSSATCLYSATSQLQQENLNGTWMAAASSYSTGDTTTLWTSLGTLVFQTAATGRAIIKRLA